MTTDNDYRAAARATLGPFSSVDREAEVIPAEQGAIVHTWQYITTEEATVPPRLDQCASEGPDGGAGPCIKPANHVGVCTSANGGRWDYTCQGRMPGYGCGGPGDEDGAGNPDCGGRCQLVDDHDGGCLCSCGLQWGGA